MQAWAVGRAETAAYLRPWAIIDVPDAAGDGRVGYADKNYLPRWVTEESL